MKTSALLDDATNMFGPLSPELRSRIYAFLVTPDEAHWDDISSICIRPFRTVWQAVIAADPTFPRTGPQFSLAAGKRVKGWSRVPDALLVARAIKACNGPLKENT